MEDCQFILPSSSSTSSTSSSLSPSTFPLKIGTNKKTRETDTMKPLKKTDDIMMDTSGGSGGCNDAMLLHNSHFKERYPVVSNGSCDFCQTESVNVDDLDYSVCPAEAQCRCHLSYSCDYRTVDVARWKALKLHTPRKNNNSNNNNSNNNNSNNSNNIINQNNCINPSPKNCCHSTTKWDFSTNSNSNNNNNNSNSKNTTSTTTNNNTKNSCSCCFHEHFSSSSSSIETMERRIKGRRKSASNLPSSPSSCPSSLSSSSSSSCVSQLTLPSLSSSSSPSSSLPPPAPCPSSSFLSNIVDEVGVVDDNHNTCMHDQCQQCCSKEETNVLSYFCDFNWWRKKSRNSLEPEDLLCTTRTPTWKWDKFTSKLHRFMARFSGRRRPRRWTLNSSSIIYPWTRMTSFLYVIFVVTGCLHIADACSSRSTPKPRPPSPTLRPNITIQTYTCPAEYDAHYCLNGATCFTVKIGESILYNCECAEGYMGQRCEFKDLDGSYLPSKQRAMLEQAGITSGVAIMVVFVIIVCFYLYVRSRRKSDFRRNSGHDEVDSHFVHKRPFSGLHSPIPVQQQQNHHNLSTSSNNHNHHQHQSQHHQPILRLNSNSDGHSVILTSTPTANVPIVQSSSSLLTSSSTSTSSSSSPSNIKSTVLLKENNQSRLCV